MKNIRLVRTSSGRHCLIDKWDHKIYISNKGIEKPFLIPMHTMEYITHRLQNDYYLTTSSLLVKDFDVLYEFETISEFKQMHPELFI